MKKFQNKKVSALFQIDPIVKLNKKSDSTLAIIKEGFNFGIDSWVGFPHDVSLKKNLIHMRAQKVLDTNFNLGDPKEIKINKYDFFFIRQDPPFNLRYLTNCYVLEIHKKFNKKPIFINNPSGIKNFTEKIFPLYFSDFMPKTYLSEDIDFFLSLLKKHKSLVLKTLFNKGGEGVEMVNQSDKNRAVKIFTNLIKKYSVPVIIQEYIDAVKFGDKRVILLDGNPVGAINRIPKKGDFKANLHLGGKAEITDLTKNEKKICQSFKKVFTKEGLFLVGIDLINEKLTEINVTSPTGIVQINDLTGINIAKKLWAKLIKKIN